MSDSTFTGEEAAGNHGKGVWLVGPHGDPRLMPNILAFSCVHDVDDHKPCQQCQQASTEEES